MKKSHIRFLAVALMAIAFITTTLAGDGKDSDRDKDRVGSSQKDCKDDKNKGSDRDKGRDGKDKDNKSCDDPRLPKGWHWEQRSCRKKSDHHDCSTCVPTYGSENQTGGFYSYISLAGIASVPQLDPTNVLTGVSLSFRTRAYARVGFENTDSASQDAYVTADLFITVTPPLVLPELSAVAREYISSYQTNLPSSDGTIDFGGPSGFSLDPLLDASDTTLPVAISNIGAFAGTGTVDFAVTSHSESFLGGGSNIQASFISMGGGDVYVTYTYLKPCPPNGGEGGDEDDHDDDHEHHDEHDSSCHRVVIGPN